MSALPEIISIRTPMRMTGLRVHFFVSNGLDRGNSPVLMTSALIPAFHLYDNRRNPFAFVHFSPLAVLP